MRRPPDPARPRTPSSIVATFTALAALAALPSPATAAGKAHEHGVGKLDVAIDAGRVSVLLDTPLDPLVGFERAPRNDAERRRADDAIAKLKNAAAMVHIDPAAQCTPEPPALKAPVLEAGARDAGDTHADLAVEYTFRCAGAAPGWIEVGLFAAFERLQRLDVQIAGAKGQARRTLRRPAARIELSGR